MSKKALSKGLLCRFPLPFLSESVLTADDRKKLNKIEEERVALTSDMVPAYKLTRPLYEGVK